MKTTYLRLIPGAGTSNEHRHKSYVLIARNKAGNCRSPRGRGARATTFESDVHGVLSSSGLCCFCRLLGRAVTPSHGRKITIAGAMVKLVVLSDRRLCDTQHHCH